MEEAITSFFALIFSGAFIPILILLVLLDLLVQKRKHKGQEAKEQKIHKEPADKR